MEVWAFSFVVGFVGDVNRRTVSPSRQFLQSETIWLTVQSFITFTGASFWPRTVAG
jgi:hypothetical protein